LDRYIVSMRIRYKNQKQKLKAELETERKLSQKKSETIQQLTARLSEKRKQEEEAKKKATETKRYNAIVYCKNCMQVNEVRISEGSLISHVDCVYCRVRGELLPVVWYPGKIRV
jgi:predicted RNase H-like nuclease (RuvC/YqgF family)